MRYLPSVLAGIAAVALAGSMAMAAGNDLPLHHMTVPLPKGGSLRVEYAGNVPPRVSVAPGPFDVAWPDFANSASPLLSRIFSAFPRTWIGR